MSGSSARTCATCATTCRSRQKTYQTGLYVQDQIALDNWRLTLGGREDWVHTGATFYNKGDATNTSRDKKFSGNAALSYIFDNGVAPYISYAESFQPTGSHQQRHRQSESDRLL
ncbi:TonB-dependent receptor domain-containing protein [Pseudomonas aeruginosa]